MYLHYYLNEKYVGAVDIETFFDVKNKKTLITVTDECDLHVGALEMMYGKRIERFTVGQAFDIRFGKWQPRTRTTTAFPPHVFVTKKCGPVLKWDDREHSLCV